MTTFYTNECKCAVCGAVERYNVLGGTNAFGSSDLDLRPPEMQRSTMSTWVQECPKCGYVAGSVSNPTTVTAQWLQSESYRTCDGMAFASDLAKRFYKYYLVNMEDGKLEGAFHALLHAAWACDDSRDRDNAKRCREMAVDLSRELDIEDAEKKETICLMRADLMRRAGQFDQLLKEYADVTFKTELLNQILSFQLERAAQKDTACYTVKEAIGE